MNQIKVTPLPNMPGAGGSPANSQPMSIPIHPQPMNVNTSNNQVMNPQMNQPMGMQTSIPMSQGISGMGPMNMPQGMTTSMSAQPIGMQSSMPQGMQNSMSQVSISHMNTMNTGQSGMHPNQPININPNQPGMNAGMMMNMPGNMSRPSMGQPSRVNSSTNMMPTASIPGSPSLQGLNVQSTQQIVNPKPITPAISTSLPTDKHVISREKLQELVQMFDSTERLDAEAEDLLLLVADEFVDSVTEFACKLAKHRKSNTLEARDLELHLEKAWNIKIPGYCTTTAQSADSIPVRRPNSMTASHQQRLSDIKKTKK